MQRRKFLELSAITFTSLLGQLGCRDEGTGPGEDGPAREVIDGPEWFPQSVASGDPRPGAVILWTRVEDPARPEEDYEVELEIWPLVEGDGSEEDEAIETTVVAVTAEARFDHCVKVRAEGLQAGREYEYRFLYVVDDVAYASRTARTKTAPEPNADVPARFAVVSCQDYAGRYYNAYAAMREQTLDFFVHLGDYIYETAGDSSFQETDGDRVVVFDDEAGALALTSSDGSTFYAARSLSNYRQLYRIFRSDSALQAIHERLAMVAVWDDHEFSDDCHGSTATYHDGREDETDPARRAAANQAWFEYMPVDYPDPSFVYDPAVAPPGDIRIYRDLEYGLHLHLVMTDLRSHRPDHLVPEDAYPGAVVVDADALAQMGGDPSEGVPYVDIESHGGGSYAELLRSLAQDAGYDPGRVTGNVSAAFVNEAIADSGSALAPIEQNELDALPRGIAIHQMFKTSYFGQLGARYLLVQPPFLRYAEWLNRQTGGAAQAIMGEAQEGWFLDTMRGSGHTWKVWGNEFCITPLDIDLTESFLPEAFRQAFQMTAEDWNGAPHRRQSIIDALASVDNVVAITGDIHAFFAGTPFAWPRELDGNRIVEFVTGSISSTSYQSLLVRQVQADPGLSSVAGIEAFALGIRDLLQGGPNPQMAYAETGKHGFSIVEVSGDALVVEMHQHGEELVGSERYDDSGLLGEFSQQRFRVLPGSRDLYRDADGTWERWDPATRTWVA